VNPEPVNAKRINYEILVYDHLMQRENLSHTSTHNHPGPKKQSPRDIYLFTLKALMLGCIVFLSFFIYSNNLTGPFFFDDEHNIQNNSHIRLTRLTWDGIKRAGLKSPETNRPVANISFALNYYFHSYYVVGYHLVNILIHIITGLLLFLFIKTTLNLPLLRFRYESSEWIPYLAALIWLVHPIQTQSVSYIVQRMNSMMAMFYILSLWLYARARLAESKRNKGALFAGCILSGILALGTKETAATLPFFIYLYEWFFFQDLSRDWLKRNLFYFIGLLILLTAIALLYLDAHPLEKILSGYTFRNFTLTQRVLTEFRVVIFYISLLIFPHSSRLNLDHDFPLSYSLIDPLTTLLSIVIIAGLIGLALYLAKKERLVSFCLFWFFGNLVIESSVIGLEIVFEHRTYLPSMLAVLPAVILANRYIGQKWVKVAAVCSVVMVCSTWTYERNSMWNNEVAFWDDCVKKSPQKARPHNNLGNALKRQGKLEESIYQYHEALRIRPTYSKAHNNLGIAFAAQGKIKEAISHFSMALRIRPDYATAHSNIGVTLARQGRLEEAITHFLEALRIKPDYAKVHSNLGVALLRQGRLKEALGHFYEALRIKPDDLKSYQKLKICLELIKKDPGASKPILVPE